MPLIGFYEHADFDMQVKQTSDQPKTLGYRLDWANLWRDGTPLDICKTCHIRLAISWTWKVVVAPINVYLTEIVSYLHNQITLSNVVEMHDNC